MRTNIAGTQRAPRSAISSASVERIDVVLDRFEDLKRRVPTE
jgi:hypothetical protein